MSTTTALLTVAETAAALHLGRTTVYELIRTGQLPVLRVGRAIRVPESTLAAWIDSNTRKATP